MNSFTKGLLTGVFGVVVGLVISGSNYQDGQLFGLGTYQISTTTGDGAFVKKGNATQEAVRIWETIIDTKTGEVVSRNVAWNLNGNPLSNYSILNDWYYPRKVDIKTNNTQQQF